MENNFKSSKRTTLQEYLLQGTILDTQIEYLLNRLNGLCDTADSGAEQFHDHETVYIIKAEGNDKLKPVNVHVRKSLMHPEEPYHMRYVGQADTGIEDTPTLMRTVVDIGTQSHVISFLEELGFKLNYEFVTKGYMFRKGLMKITVTKLFKMTSAGNTENVEMMFQSHLVEASMLGAHGNEKLQEQMKTFAQHLKPLVHLEKIDHRTLKVKSMQL